MARILDLAPHVAIYAGRMLAEAGHEVIRVEHPTGDEIRRLAASADAVIGDLPPGLEPEAFHAEYPHLVIGVLRNAEIPEICQYARSGMLGLTGQPGGTP